MNGTAIIAALDLPAGARVEQRVPKKLLLDNGAPTAADKRLINNGIEELIWVAALKPTTIGVPDYRDAVREYLEVAVLHLTTRAQAKAHRLVELVHRAVPYPVFLVLDQMDGSGLSAAHKRWSQGQAGKTVLDGNVVGVECRADRQVEPFLATLSIGRQPRATLFELYHGWMESLRALLASQLTGTFSLAATPEAARLRQEALQELSRLDVEAARLRAAAQKEPQLARQVELNLELKRIEAAQTRERLKL